MNETPPNPSPFVPNPNRPPAQPPIPAVNPEILQARRPETTTPPAVESPVTGLQGLREVVPHLLAAMRGNPEETPQPADTQEQPAPEAPIASEAEQRKPIYTESLVRDPHRLRRAIEGIDEEPAIEIGDQPDVVTGEEISITTDWEGNEAVQDEVVEKVAAQLTEELARRGIDPSTVLLSGFSGADLTQAYRWKAASEWSHGNADEMRGSFQVDQYSIYEEDFRQDSELNDDQHPDEYYDTLRDDEGVMYEGPDQEEYRDDHYDRTEYDDVLGQAERRASGPEAAPGLRPGQSTYFFSDYRSILETADGPVGYATSENPNIGVYDKQRLGQLGLSEGGDEVVATPQQLTNALKFIFRPNYRWSEGGDEL